MISKLFYLSYRDVLLLFLIPVPSHTFYSRETSCKIVDIVWSWTQGKETKWTIKTNEDELQVLWIIILLSLPWELKTRFLSGELFTQS